MGGENLGISAYDAQGQGSSPRGRGKRILDARFGGQVGLIPAWAGKTGAVQVETGKPRAHPRVGGENSTPLAASWAVMGSSPRGRGKRAHSLRLALQPGLIPAWAGKTPCSRAPSGLPPAHPRVGGENLPDEIATCQAGGSSPRGRGKRHGPGPELSRGRLIPAWAGKTASNVVLASCAAAHPRVGGENLVIWRMSTRECGSSPRGRGKLPHRGSGRKAGRLIPAWAGKTAGACRT